MASYCYLSKSIQQGTSCKTCHLPMSRIQQCKLSVHQSYLCLPSIHSQEGKCNKELKRLGSTGFLSKPQAQLQDLNIGYLQDMLHKPWTHRWLQMFPAHIL